MQVIGHRGLPRQQSENTIDSFLAAIEANAHMIELDVRMTADQVLVVRHDRMVHYRAVSNLTYKELLELSQENIPTLEEVLLAVKGLVSLNVEIKKLDCTQKTVAILKEHLSLKDFVITSFKPKVLKTVYELDPNIQTGLLIPGVKSILKDSSPISKNLLIKRLEACNANFIVLHHFWAKPRLLEILTETNYPIIVWTVNKPKLILKYSQDLRIKGIITDVADEVVELLLTKESVDDSP